MHLCARENEGKMERENPFIVTRVEHPKQKTREKKKLQICFIFARISA
jgi:hypothetical protein